MAQATKVALTIRKKLCGTSYLLPAAGRAKPQAVAPAQANWQSCSSMIFNLSSKLRGDEEQKRSIAQFPVPLHWCFAPKVAGVFL